MPSSGSLWPTPVGSQPVAQGNDSGPFVGDSGVSRQRDATQEPKVMRVQPPAAHVSPLTEISHLSDTRTPKWLKCRWNAS